MDWQQQQQQQQQQTQGNGNDLQQQQRPQQQQSYPSFQMPQQLQTQNPFQPMNGQNYPYPSPFNNSGTYPPYFGMQQSMQLQQQQPISPFQHQPQISHNSGMIAMQNNINNQQQQQPSPQKLQFNSKQDDKPPPPDHENHDEEEKLLYAQTDEEETASQKQRLDYSKLRILGPTEPWILSGREPMDLTVQTTKENKIFGDVYSVFKEIKLEKASSMNLNARKQECRLFLDYKAKKLKMAEEEKQIDDNNDYVPANYQQNKSQPLLMYAENLRVFYDAFNEYQRYKLLRVQPLSSYPSSPCVSIKLHLFSVLFKDLNAFTIEDYLTQQILFDYKIYAKYLLDTETYIRKITLLRTRIDQILTNNSLSVQKQTISLLDELISIRHKKDEIQSKIKQLFTKIYMNWRNLQSWRYNEGLFKYSSFANNDSMYQGTKLMVYLKKVEPNKIQQQIEYNQAAKDELFEIEQLIALKNKLKQKDEMPQVFKAEAVKQSILQRQNAYLSVPGTVDYVAFVDADSHHFSSTDSCNATERFRRRQLSNYTLLANIFVHDEDGKRTKITQTNKENVSYPSFECALQFELEINLLSRPQFIEIELCSHSWFISSKIANVKIPTNTKDEECGEMTKDEILFESETVIATNRNFTNREYETYAEAANGAWNRKICGSISYGMQIEIMEQRKEEPMQVAVIPNPEKEQKEQKNEEKLLLVDVDEIADENAADHLSTFRQKILKLRQRYAISEDVAVPLFDGDISDNLYKAVHDETKQEIAYRNEMILDRINNATLDVSEVVRERNIDLLPCCSFSLYSLFTPRRKLRPQRSYFANSTSINPENCKIVIQILQSRNLPIRKSNNMQMAISNQMNIVQPFIEVSFMNNSVRTFTSFGANARWEQTLFVEFEVPGNGKFTPSNLQKISDNLEISVYDELIVSKQNDERAHHSQIQRREKRYLGTITIPFTAIYFNQNIEGYFKLKTPLIQLGYSKNYNEPALISLFATLDPPILNPHQFGNNESSSHQSKYYEWIRNNHAQREDEEQSKFIQYCIEWTDDVQRMNGRQIEIFASNKRNEPELVCRFLRSVEPPMQVTPEIFLRFVACIPYKEDIHLIPGARDLWMDNCAFLKIGSGDDEEHANLLCCYFMWFDAQNPNSGWSTFMAMGKSKNSDAHNSMYVLRRNATQKHLGGVSVQNVILYDAENGISYSMQTEKNQLIPLCDLCDISIVYNETQIYANMQSQVAPSSELFCWEFENKSMWKPLFEKNSSFKSDSFCLPSLQTPALEYIASPNEYYQKRQNKLEYIIEKQFDEWRNLPTKWNYAICKTLREILRRMEPQSQTGGHVPMINDCDPQIFAINQIYSKMYGFPLNLNDNGSDNLMLESNQNPAVKMVKNTKVHENDDPNAEFARAVFIYPYTNKIAAVWIYIASLSKQ